MPEELRLPVLAAAVLLWYLVRSLRQLRSEQRTSPTVVWRETAAMATAVQFAVIAHPDDAPDYTIQVLFMSDVRELSLGRALASSGCEG
jgi:hypothetical protein